MTIDRKEQLMDRQQYDNSYSDSKLELYWRGSASQMFVDDIRAGRCVRINASRNAAAKRALRREGK